MIVALLIAGFFIVSCKDENNSNKPAPTITLTPTSTSNAPGQAVSTSVVVDAPEGGKKLTILVNGAANAAIPDVDLAGETSKTVAASYTIPASAVVGSTIVLSFQATDAKDQASLISSFTITISAVPAKQVVVISGNITENTAWTKDKIYKLIDKVRIGRDEKDGSGVPQITATATLTIEAGTLIIGERASKGTLIVQRGSKLIAEGTATSPIIFTSERAIGTREAGDWGGVVICGKAANNIKAAAGSPIPDGVAELEGAYGGFHGSASPDNADNSGSLKFVRIEYAGVPIQPNQEINGLTFGSVGSGTTIENVQVSYSNDDSFEWFGGTVNCKNLIAFRGLDDDFDTDNGFSGHVQFGLGIRGAQIADQSGSNGFESDNDGTGSGNQPYTSAVFSNMTLIGPKETRETPISVQFQSAAQLRRNTRLNIINSFFTSYPNGVFIDNNGSVVTTDNATNGDLKLKNNLVAGVNNWGGNGFGSTGAIFASAPANGANHPNNPRGFRVAAGTGAFSNGVYTVTPAQISSQEAEAWFVSVGNTIVDSWNDGATSTNSTIINGNLFENGTPTVIPPAGSALLTGGSVAGFTGFQDVSYRGAFSTTDWTAQWANWNPQTTDYSK